jgi:branched-chain amino acid transport system ATP-binding protein
MNLTVTFGGVHALRDVSFVGQRSGVLGLIGPNGAGKSTFISCVAGSLVPSAGSIHWSGTELTDLRADQIAAVGVARTFQHARLFAGLTVLENVMVGAHRAGRSTAFGAMFRSPRYRQDERELRAVAAEALAAIHAEHLANRPTEDLTAGQQRLVAIARAIVSEPSLLLLDEPAAGLTDAERELLANDLRAYFAAHELTALIVEHNLGFLMPLVSHVVVFDQGRVLSEGTPAEVRSDPAVIAAYLGDDHAAT